MNIFGRTKNKEELALVFDVGSSSVGGALLKMRKDGSATIIYSIREPITLEKEINFERFFNLTLKSLEIVANKICMKGLGSPKKVFCVLSSPWYASQTRSILLKKNVPFIFSAKLVDSLIQKEVSLVESESREKYLHTQNKVVPIELKNMQILLNGYRVDNPLNQKADNLEMSVFVSMSGEEILEKMKEMIGKHFYVENIKFSSFAMASFSTARDYFIHQNNFLLIDIGGEVTDISMVKKDILRSSISFSFGPNFFIRGISSILGCSLNEALSYFSMYKDGHMHDDTTRRIEPIIKKLKVEWLKSFQESLVNLSNDISIPSTIFLTVDQEFSEFFIDTIKSEQFNQYTLTESKFQIVYLGNQAMHGIVLFEKDVARDPFIVIESIYINRFFT